MTMWRWKEKAALEDNQQMTGAFILYLISLKAARRYGGPNEVMFADAKMCLFDSLICAIKGVGRFFKKMLGFNTGLLLRAAAV